MAWKQIVKHSGPFMHPMDWHKRPQVSVRKRQMTLNRLAIESFGLRAGHLIDVFVDQERGLLGLKSADCGSPAAYRLSDNRARSRCSVTVNCSEVAKCFPHAVGQTFDLVLHPGESVIVAEVGLPKS